MSVSRWLDSFPIINSTRKTLFKSKLIGAVTAGVVGYAIYRGLKYAMQKREVTVSAPGKALIAGGYLVLEHPNIGIVVSCTSRFYTTVIDLTGPQIGERVDAYPSVEQIEAAKQGSCVLILVESPQFHSQFLYSYNYQSGQLVQLECSPLASSASATSKVEKGEMKKNEFVERCLSLVFIFLHKRLTSFTRRLEKMCEDGTLLGIKLRADNDFYSQVKELEKRGAPMLSESLATLPRFLPCPKDAITGEVQVAKTGMGSSAALTVSFVGAVLKFFECVELEYDTTDHAADLLRRVFRPHEAKQLRAKKTLPKQYEEELRIIHNLSQLVHAIAQGKIGSGFDVSAAVYGSQMYQRFNPEGFRACMDQYANTSGPGDTRNFVGEAGEALFVAVTDDSLWQHGAFQAFAFPQGFDMVMGDVCGGSQSISMARAVLKWRSDGGAEADRVWQALAATNSAAYEQVLLLLSYELNFPKEYKAVLDHVSTTPFHAWNAKGEISGGGEGQQRAFGVLLEIKKSFATMRHLLKTMGNAARVDIEPDSQTQLCDETEKLPGVLCCGVPGAGGVDAVFAIVLCPAARIGVEKMWSGWAQSSGSGTAVCPLLLRAEIDPRESGARVEDLAF
jgi:phosphomevalonate kinase